MSGPPEPWLALTLILLLIFCPFEKRGEGLWKWQMYYFSKGQIDKHLLSLWLVIGHFVGKRQGGLSGSG